MKEKVLISACLLGVNCKYNGKNNLKEELLKDILDKYEVIPICPEVWGGLTIPRDPSEKVGDKVLTSSGKDVTENYKRGAIETLNLAKLLNITKAILRAKSPSCGNGNIYDGTFTSTLIEGDGVTTKLLKENGIEIIMVI